MEDEKEMTILTVQDERNGLPNAMSRSAPCPETTSPPDPTKSSSVILRDVRADRWTKKQPGGPYRMGPNRPPPYTPRANVYSTEAGNLQTGTTERSQQRWLTTDDSEHPSPNLVLSTFTDDYIRRKFVSKVYSILAVQFLITTVFVVIFTFSDEAQEFAVDYVWLAFVFLGIYMITYLVLVCVQKARRYFPLNIILLTVMTLSQSFVAGILASAFEVNVVLYAMAATFGIFLMITIVAGFCPIDVTGCGMVCCMLSLVVCVFSLVTIIIMMFIRVPILHLVYCGVCVVLFSLFMLYDTQMILGGRRIELSPEEYILGAVQLYVDYITIFYSILPLVGACCEH